jgi:hypothetical protein
MFAPSVLKCAAQITRIGQITKPAGSDALWILPLVELSVLSVSCGYLASFIMVVYMVRPDCQRSSIHPNHSTFTARDAENAEAAQRVETAPALDRA